MIKYFSRWGDGQTYLLFKIIKTNFPDKGLHYLTIVFNSDFSYQVEITIKMIGC